MRLKKIRLAGFKSFVAETQVDLNAGFTAIVGPNGCGKTNILDAVRWVLGEKSARNLRGKSMDDVIFQGSALRKPAGMAEVELFFDNSSRLLGLDLEEIVVGRRIYLSSASEYLLNGKKTTRREIERIFMDTGVGKAAYSIMEQGRMAEILQASPEDRRLLFDEAAGIARFKAEKAETTQRLEDTNRNLERLSDIIKTRQQEIAHLETQAERTRKYLSLKGELDQADRELRYIKYLDLEERRLKVEARLQKLLGRREELQQELEQLEKDQAGREALLERSLEEFQERDREYHRDVSQINSLEQNIERARSDRESQLERLNALSQKKTDEERRLDAARKRHSSSLQLELNLSEEIRLATESLAHLQQAMDGLAGRIAAGEEQERKLRQEQQKLETEQEELVFELRSVTEQFLKDLQEKRSDLEQNEAERLGHREMILQGLADFDELLSRALADLKSEEWDRCAEKLRQPAVGTIRNHFLAIEELDLRFRSLFFEERGWLKRKAHLDERMEAIGNRRTALGRELLHIEESRRQDRLLLERDRKRSVEMELQLQDFKTRLQSSAELKADVERHVREVEEALSYFSEEIRRCLGDKDRLASEEELLFSSLSSAQARTEEQHTTLEQMRQTIEEIRTGILSLKETVRSKRSSMEELLPSISEQERRFEQIRMGLGALEEDLYNDFQSTVSELVELCRDQKLDPLQVENQYKRIKEEIRYLGAFNPLAIEELSRARELMAEIEKQKSDVEEARENILQLLRDIDVKSARIFSDTFTQIQENFSSVFQTLFGGGTASLSLTEPENLLSSGVEIMAQPPGKKNASISLLSGGEQNMTAIALMFAIYLVRPSPFCFLDEIDAPLDDQNVVRFLRMLQGFLDRSQFMVITHNKLTMSHADCIYGVTQEEAGVSKLVSVRMKEERPAMAG
ncbi:MAG: AAA family ATPase [Spirochaetales bacterium]|nr:AAA family ATPase [Spirochaetales bacterium]